MSDKIIEALEVHGELNPVLWDGMELKEEVKNKLLEIANTFIEGLNYPLNVADIRFLGSNASFNYNDNSDIDLHIISNFELSYVDKDILQILYNASKNSFNNHHDITIKGIPVEIYIEDMHSMNATNGAYSLLKDEWVMIPKPIEYTIPDYSNELQEYLGEIDYVMNGGSKEEIEDLINRIYLGRKDGLATEGEASIGNCVFKELRNMGWMEKLRERFYELESQELTLENKKLEEDDSIIDDVVTELQDEPTQEQIEEKEKEYTDYIETHVANVKKAYERIVRNLVNNDLTGAQMEQLEANIEAHDKDKYIPFMFDAYRRNHMPINEKEKQDAEEDYTIAWDYHKRNNTHHWEYWLNSADEFAQDINEAEMKLAYAEMFCDWLSFGFRKESTSATGESTEFEVWYNDSKDNIKIHPQLREWFDDKVNAIIDYINTNRDGIYAEVETEGKHLTKFKSYDKIIDEDVNIGKVGDINMTESEKEKELNRMNEWTQRIMGTSKLEETSMSKVVQYMSHYQVGFITAFRWDMQSKSAKQDANYNLKLDIYQDLSKSKLSYLKVDGAYSEEKNTDGELVQVFEETFAVINDQYDYGDFKNIMVKLANKYNQDGVLIVYPPNDDEKKIEDNITSIEYDKDGNESVRYKGFSIQQYDKFKDKNPDEREYYTKVGNKKLSFNNREEIKREDKEPEFDIYTYRLKKKGNLGSMLEAQRKHCFVENFIKELDEEKLEEGGMSRVLQLLQEGYFATVSGEINISRYAYYVAQDEELTKLLGDNYSKWNTLSNKDDIENELNIKYADELSSYNKNIYSSLKNYVRGLGYGFMPVDGVYTYEDGTEGIEKSLFVSASKENRTTLDAFREDMLNIGKTFYQESMVIGNSTVEQNSRDEKGRLIVDASLYDCQTGEVLKAEDFDTEFDSVKLSDFTGFLSRLKSGKEFATYKVNITEDYTSGMKPDSLGNKQLMSGMRLNVRDNYNKFASEIRESYNKLQEQSYNDYKKEVGFNLEYRVIAPITVEQKDSFDSYGDNDYEMDVNIDSLYDAYEEAQEQVLSLTSDEDLLKEIFPNVGRGRVYVGNVEIDEDKLDFDIGFSNIVDPVEKGNDIKLDENDIKDQIVELVNVILDNLDWLSVRQGYTYFTGEVDEDGEGVEEYEESDAKVSFSLSLDTNKPIDIQTIQSLSESKKV